MIGHCPKCGGAVSALYSCRHKIRHDVLCQCDVCGSRMRQSETIEDGPEAEALREAHEAAIGDRQFQEWNARKLASTVENGESVVSAGGVE